MTREIRRVYCNRPSKRHTLAVVRDDGVEVSLAAEWTSGVSVTRELFAKDSVTDETSSIVHAACACGHVYEVDLAALFRGEDLRTPLPRVPPGDAYGVSHHRRPGKMR